MSKPPEFPGSRRLRRVAAPTSSKGRAYEGAFEAVGSILVSTGIGYWVDHAYETTPYGVLVGAAVGFAAFVLRLVRLGQRVYADSADDAAAQAPDGETRGDGEGKGEDTGAARDREERAEGREEGVGREESEKRQDASGRDGEPPGARERS